MVDSKYIPYCQAILCFLIFLFVLPTFVLVVIDFTKFDDTKSCPNPEPLISGIASAEIASLGRIIKIGQQGIQIERALKTSKMGKKCLENCERAFCEGAYTKSIDVPCQKKGTGISDNCPSYELCVYECDVHCPSSNNQNTICFIDSTTIC